ncbi:DNA-binding protein snt1 [Malassezia nana]|uniref:DNA-binding protein snt1 n=1 Tax=Malassezia nana TaxID=180528 RepID=A0AAF0ESL1_9BASI|nr:DNA-binding protein snt1 [Malassezia nana]
MVLRPSEPGSTKEKGAQEKAPKSPEGTIGVPGMPGAAIPKLTRAAELEASGDPRAPLRPDDGGPGRWRPRPDRNRFRGRDGIREKRSGTFRPPRDHPYYDHDRAGLDQLRVHRPYTDPAPSIPEDLYGHPEDIKPAVKIDPAPAVHPKPTDGPNDTLPPPAAAPESFSSQPANPDPMQVDVSSEPFVQNTQPPTDTAAPTPSKEQESDAPWQKTPAEPVMPQDTPQQAMVPEMSQKRHEETPDSASSAPMSVEGPPSLTPPQTAPPQQPEARPASSSPIPHEPTTPLSRPALSIDVPPQDAESFQPNHSTEQSVADLVSSHETVDKPAESPSDDVDERGEELRKATFALAQQMLVRYPLTEQHVQQLMQTNQALAHSQALPASLHETKVADAPIQADPALVQERIHAQVQAKEQAYEAKLQALREEYRTKHQAWTEYCRRLDQMYERRAMQRSGASAHDDSPMSSSLLSAVSTPASSRTFRRGGIGSGGFGDVVRSEAEFQEILASLENAEMQDPAVRAARTSATVPDMDLREPLVFDNDNGYVADPVHFYFDRFDPDVWSEEEKAIFARRYVLYPKQFGRIAEKLPHKTAKQCVAFYYLHKHLEGYKALLHARHRERRKKTKSRPSKSKGSALMADIAATDPKIAEEDKSAAPKRRPEDVTPKPKRTKSATKPKRESESERPVPEPETASERDLAAAEALEALAGLAMPARPEPKKRKSRKEGEEPKSRSRGPHWSMTERAEFLRLLATYGKDWHALSASFSAKTPAQTRNFFARHASESEHFQEAAALAQKHAHMSWEDKAQAAVDFVQQWYESLPEGAVKASITGWPAPGHAPPPPPPKEPVPPVQQDEAPADDDETDEDERSAGPPGATPVPSVPPMSHRPPATANSTTTPVPPPAHAEPSWTPMRSPMAPMMYGSPAYGTMPPGPVPMYYHEPSAYTSPVPPMGLYNYSMPKYGLPTDPHARYGPEATYSAPSPISRVPMRPAPNMGYFPARPERWPGSDSRYPPS